MAIKHAVTKASGEKGLASEWNDDHVISGEVDLSNVKVILPIETSDTAPTLTETGEIKIWQSGAGIYYDPYNSSIDPNLWTTSKTGSFSAYSETASYIEAMSWWPISNFNPGSNKCTVYTKDMPDLDEMTEVSFRAVGSCDSGGSGATTTAKLYIWGILVKNLGAGQTDDSIWKAIRNPDNTWDIYDDDVLVLSSQTAINNTIKIYSEISYSGGAIAPGGPAWYYKYDLYPILIGGGTYLMIKDSNKTLYLRMGIYKYD